MRDGSYHLHLLHPLKRAQWTLVAVVKEAHTPGVGTRRVDGLVQIIGVTGIVKSQVIPFCEEMGGEVERCRIRRLDGPNLWVLFDVTSSRSARADRLALGHW